LFVCDTAARLLLCLSHLTHFLRFTGIELTARQHSNIMWALPLAMPSLPTHLAYTV